MAKFLKFEKAGPLETVAVLRAVAEQPSQGGRVGITVASMRERGRILDALDKAAAKGDDGVILEDADHRALCGLIDAFEFATAKPELLRLIDGMVKAEDVPELRKPASDKSEKITKLADKRSTT